MASNISRGMKKVNENILARGRAIIVTEKDKDDYTWADIPVGSKFIDTNTGVEMVKLEGESDWVPSGIKNDGTISIAKDTIIKEETFTITTLDNGDGTFTYTNSNGEIRHMPLTTDGGYVFELEDGEYPIMRNQLEVWIDDVLRRNAKSGGIEELNTKRFVITEKLTVGMEIAAKYSSICRVGNPYPRIFSNKTQPDTAEIGDLWIDTDGEMSDMDVLGTNPDVYQTIPWERVTGKPNTVSGYGISDPISYQGHKHSYSDIYGTPTMLPANGGNADSVQHLKPNNNAPNSLAVLDANAQIPKENIGPHKHTMTDITGFTQISFSKGMIMLWYGSVSNIPSGWVLCNGLNGTPDLRNRFVIGAGGNYTQGATGGEASHTLTIDEMPNHKHVDPYAENENVGSSAPFGIADSTHNHCGSNRTDYDNSLWYTSATGGDKPHNNMPPYYALFYIMKL